MHAEQHQDESDRRHALTHEEGLTDGLPQGGRVHHEPPDKPCDGADALRDHGIRDHGARIDGRAAELKQRHRRDREHHPSSRAHETACSKTEPELNDRLDERHQPKGDGQLQVPRSAQPIANEGAHLVVLTLDLCERKPRQQHKGQRREHHDRQIDQARDSVRQRSLRR